MRVKETTLYELGDVFEIKGGERFVLVEGREIEGDFKILELISLKTFQNISESISVPDEIISEDIRRIAPGIWSYVGTFKELYKVK